MKKIFLVFLILLSLPSFAQNDFRKMNWGDSPAQLKAKYPDVTWEKETEGSFLIFSTDDNIGGLATTINYFFIENKLQMGAYFFIEDHSSKNLYYDNFISISKILNEKYDMEIEEKWNNDRWKDDKNNIGHALQMGYVQIIETYNGQQTSIIHSISGNNYKIDHTLLYFSMDYANSMKGDSLDDF